MVSMGRGTKTLLDFQEYYFDINESRGRKKDLGKNTDLHNFAFLCNRGVTRRHMPKAFNTCYTTVRDTFGSSRDTKQLGAASKLKMIKMRCNSTRKRKQGTLARLHEFKQNRRVHSIRFLYPSG